MKVTFEIPEKIVRKAIYSVMAEDENGELPADFAEKVMEKESMECNLPAMVGLKDAVEFQTAVALIAIGTYAEKESKRHE